MTSLAGHCHCGAIRVELEPGKPVEDLALRSCQCGFCRRHGARTTSDPMSRLHIEAAPGALEIYRFGRQVAEVLLCAECGCYIGSSIVADGHRLVTLNVTGVDLEGFSGRVAEIAQYEDETDKARLARRKARWTPTVLVETNPSA